jgi:hypothetical protein
MALAIGLSVIGANKATKDPSTFSTLRRVAALVYVGAFGGVVALHWWGWTWARKMPMHLRTV